MLLIEDDEQATTTEEMGANEDAFGMKPFDQIIKEQNAEEELAAENKDMEELAKWAASPLTPQEMAHTEEVKSDKPKKS